MDSEIIDLTSDDQDDDGNCTVVFFKTEKAEIAETVTSNDVWKPLVTYSSTSSEDN
uniref:Uncharacterized protein n=1 Tax=Strigamia maritima TaxID=126957 RepID=T1ILB2_STRMM